MGVNKALNPYNMEQDLHKKNKNSEQYENYN